MEQDNITIKELLAVMESGQAFRMTYVQADRRRGTGGKMVDVKDAVLSQHAVPSGKKLTQAAIQKASKSPNHSEHFTRNIVLLNRDVVKVHILLITSFNGKRVL